MYSKLIPAFQYILDQYNQSDSYFVPIAWDGAPLIKDAVLELRKLGYVEPPKALGSLSFTIFPKGVKFLEDTIKEYQ